MTFSLRYRLWLAFVAVLTGAVVFAAVAFLDSLSRTALDAAEAVNRASTAIWEMEALLEHSTSVEDSKQRQGYFSELDRAVGRVGVRMRGASESDGKTLETVLRKLEKDLATWKLQFGEEGSKQGALPFDAMRSSLEQLKGELSASRVARRRAVEQQGATYIRVISIFGMIVLALLALFARHARVMWSDRLNILSVVVEEALSGNTFRRANMKPIDEVGRLGVAVDKLLNKLEASARMTEEGDREEKGAPPREEETTHGLSEEA